LLSNSSGSSVSPVLVRDLEVIEGESEKDRETDKGRRRKATECYSQLSKAGQIGDLGRKRRQLVVGENPV
jgi:hypothetical protein